MIVRRPAIHILAAAIVLALPAAGVAADWRAKASPAVLQDIEGGMPIDVLVVFRSQPALQWIDPALPKAERGRAVMAQLQATGGQARAAVQAELAARGIRSRSLWIANAVAARLDAATLAAIAQRPDVARIESDRAFYTELPRTEAMLPKAAKAVEPNVTRVRAPEAWALGFRGHGVVVGAQDTGYQWDHPAVRNRYRGWNGSSALHAYNWYDAVRSEINAAPNPCGVASNVPCDDNSHGTHTLGTVLGDDGGANQIGVAPDAQWIGCRNMDSGDGRPSTYLACFQFFIAPTDLAGLNPDPARAPDVITNSWGCPPSEQCALDSFDNALAAVRAAGILNVVAAGNDGASCGSINTPPATSADVFTIGSTTNLDARSGFSSIGPVSIDGSNRLKPDLMAPGSSVRSAVRGGGYATFSGTSMATPNVAGVAALVMSANPALRGDPAAVEAILRETALPLSPAGLDCGGFMAISYPNHIYGYGRVDALAAVQRAAALAPLFRSGFEVLPAGASVP
jgi:serine protease AprX